MNGKIKERYDALAAGDNRGERTMVMAMEMMYGGHVPRSLATEDGLLYLNSGEKGEVTTEEGLQYCMETSGKLKEDMVVSFDSV